MAWGSTEQWVHAGELYPLLDEQHGRAATVLRRKILDGEIGVVEQCSSEDQQKLDSAAQILSSLTLHVVNQEEVA